MMMPPCLYYAVPSGSPTHVHAVAMNGTAIYISWEGIACTQQNGEIIGYIVAYSRVGGDRERTLMPMKNTAAITGLEPLSEYTVKVAAMNSNGTGSFSHPINVSTPTGT